MTPSSLQRSGASNQPRAVHWRRIVSGAAVEAELSRLVPLTDYPAIPRFLTSRLDDPAPQFEQQLDDIRRVTAEQIGSDLSEAYGSHVPSAYQRMAADADAAVAELCEALAGYHDQVIRPRWATMRAVLNREIIRQAYAFTTRPVAEALNRVHPGVGYHDGVISIARSDGAVDRSDLGDRVLMLTPLICAPGGLIADVYGRDTVKIGYAIPAAYAVWSTAPGSHPEAHLADLLGETRARILIDLNAPATTTALSAELGFAPATVSEHLAALHALGLLERSRVGRHVHYCRTPTGDKLIDLFSSEPYGPV